MQYGHSLWCSPLVLIISLYFLWTIFGWSIVPGILVVILMIPLNVWFMDASRKLQTKQMILKDERICIINEIISSMKVGNYAIVDRLRYAFVEDLLSSSFNHIIHFRSDRTHFGHFILTDTYFTSLNYEIGSFGSFWACKLQQTYYETGTLEGVKLN